MPGRQSTNGRAREAAPFAAAIEAANQARRIREGNALKEARSRMLAGEPWCAYCGLWLTDNTATIDHIRPRHKFGSNHPDNLWLACGDCNTFKGCHSVEAIACPRYRGGKLRLVSEISFEERVVMKDSKTSFNFDVLHEAVRDQTREHTRKIQGLIERNTAAVVEIGKRLNEVREAVGPTNFQAWLRASFRWSQSVSSNFMRIAEQFGGLKSLNQFQPSALYILVRSNIDKRVIAEAVKRADAGEIITRQQVVKLVRKFEAAPPRAAQALGANRTGILNEPVVNLRSSLRRLDISMIPPAQRIELADELLELVMQLRKAPAAAPAALPDPAPRSAGKSRKSNKRELAGV